MKTPDIPSDLVIAEELRGLLEEAISNLRDSERRALALRMDGHRYRRIGEVLGITDTAARMRVYRARKKIGARKRIKEVMLG
jgi:RNA polymerase sigma factor (sigma-70 family)